MASHSNTSSNRLSHVADITDTKTEFVTDVTAQITELTEIKNDNGTDVNVEEETANKLLYGIDETPPFGVMLSIALQNILLGLGGALSTAYVIADVICAEADNPIRAKLFCTSIFMTGICKTLQCLIGVRLPIFQGVCSTFLIPLVAMKSFKEWQCDDHSYTVLHSVMSNDTALRNISAEIVDKDAIMYKKLQEMSGCLILSSVLEVAVGMTGLVGALLRFIGPITVATVISLIGLSLYKIPVMYARTHWGIAAICIVLSVVFMLYVDKLRVPLPVGCSKKSRSPQVSRLPIFQMFPILLAVLVTWLVCGILTATGVFPDDPAALAYRARTDYRAGVIHNTPWLYVPYPGQFGAPLFNTTIFIGFVSAVISSILESIGDYYAAANICQVPRPPTHAVNRGILLEGLGSVLSGAMGAGHATTSSTGNVALIGISQVASRTCLILSGLLCIVFSIVGKLGAILSTMPDPAVGGAMFVIFGILGSIGIFTLRTIDMTSSRNLTIFGVSLYVGIVLPEWVALYPESIDTGNLTTDGVVRGILGTPMFLGGIVAAFLDNTVQGTPEERGMVHRQTVFGSTEDGGVHAQQRGSDVYNVPYLNAQRFSCFKYIPFLQSPKTEYD